MAPTITTQTHALVIDQEVSFGTIVGGPFDFLDVFVDMSASPNADNTLAEWRIYATNSGIVSLVATAPGGGAKPSVLNWNVGSSGAPGPYSPAKAAGTTYELRAFFTNSTKSFASFASPNPPPQIVKASLIGYDQFDVVPNANAAGVGILPTNFAEVTLATLNGYAQSADISIVQDFVLPVKFTLYALAGVGGVRAEVLQFTLDRKFDDISRILSPVRLPGATSYILTAAFDFPRVQFPPAVPVAVRASLAVYSSNISAGGVVILNGDVIGPSNTNTDVAWRNKPLDPATMAAPNVNDTPHWDGAKWVAAPPVAAPVVLTGNVNGPSGANRWTSLMLLANDSNVQVPEVGTVPGDGWWFVGIKALTALRTGTLPLNPTSGEVVVFTDEDGSLAAQTFNVNGNGHLVEGLAIFPMNAAYPGPRGSIAWQFDGSLGVGGEWVIFADYDANASGALALVGNTNGPSGNNTLEAFVHSQTAVPANADTNININLAPNPKGFHYAGFAGLTADRTCILSTTALVGDATEVKDEDGSLLAHNIIVDPGAGGSVDNVAGPYTMTAVQNGIKGSVTVRCIDNTPGALKWMIV